MISYVILAGMIVLISPFILSAVLVWSLIVIGLDLHDFRSAKHKDRFALAKNKFLDRLKLIVWKMRKSSEYSDEEQAEMQYIFNSSNESFDEWRYGKGEISIEIIDPDKPEDDNYRYTVEYFFTVPVEMRKEVRRLIFAFKILSFF